MTCAMATQQCAPLAQTRHAPMADRLPPALPWARPAPAVEASAKRPRHGTAPASTSEPLPATPVAPAAEQLEGPLFGLQVGDRVEVLWDFVDSDDGDSYAQVCTSQSVPDSLTGRLSDAQPCLPAPAPSGVRRRWRAVPAATLCATTPTAATRARSTRWCLCRPAASWTLRRKQALQLPPVTRPSWCGAAAAPASLP